MSIPATADLEVSTLGECTVESPMQRHWAQAEEMEIFVSDEDKILLDDSLTSVSNAFARNEIPVAFELAGPRRKLFFDPAKSSCAIVTCGDSAQVLTTSYVASQCRHATDMESRKIYGIRCGYEGLIADYAQNKRKTDPKCARVAWVAFFRRVCG